MGVSPYLCLSKNTFISLQKYLHLSPVKHILLIEKYCRKQFWNCHLRLTCKIKQREKEIITHSSRQTSAWFISVLMNATACDCTLHRWEPQLVWMSVLHKMSTKSVCCVLTNPLPQRSITHLNRDERLGGSVGWAPRTLAPAARLPALATLPCLIYKPRSTSDVFLVPTGTLWHTTCMGRTDP